MRLSATALLLCACAALSSSAAVRDSIPSVPVAPNLQMPMVGIGSCCGSYNITSWLSLGTTRHIDTSMDYGSQGTVGLAVKASGIPREELWVTSKINPEYYGSDIESTVSTLILEQLQMDYVDLLLMHHAGRSQTDKNPRPSCFTPNDPRGTYYTCRVETFKAMMQLQAKGLVKAIGVSNFEIRELQQIFNATGIYPAVNQIETHPYWHTDDIMDFCHQNNISVTAYAPMADYPRSLMLNDPALVPVAKAHGKSVGQVALRFSLQKMQGTGTIIPRSSDINHMKENIDIFDFELSDDEMASLNNLPQNKVYATQCQPWC